MQHPTNTLHPDLLATQKLVYEPNELICTNIIKEAESEEYGAFDFDLNNHHIKFRVAKITPTKIGQFVTLWKRIGNGPIQPYDMADPIDLFVISVLNADHFGQFVFPKAVLLAKDILSKDGKGGKRALRVYPPWGNAVNLRNLAYYLLQKIGISVRIFARSKFKDKDAFTVSFESLKTYHLCATTR